MVQLQLDTATNMIHTTRVVSLFDPVSRKFIDFRPRTLNPHPAVFVLRATRR